MMIDIEKVRFLKTKAENDIANAVADILDGFEKETGLYIEDVEVSMVDVTCMSDSKRRKIVQAVKLQVHVL